MSFDPVIDFKAVILAFSALAAILSITRNTSINRKRATVDLILSQLSSEKLKGARSIVSNIIHEDDLAKYASKEYAGSSEMKAILDLLNNYEFIATGIHEGAFDKKLYKRMRYSMVKQDWEAFSVLIVNIRKTRKAKTIFQEFEKLAKDFIKKPLKTRHNHQ